MTTTKAVQHTAGPWRIGPVHSDGTYAIHSNKGSIVHAIPFVSTLDSASANANLIAAAPELLEALEFAYLNLRDLTSTKDDEAVEQKMRAAIRKAKGEL